MIITMILMFTFGVMVGVGTTGIAGGNRYDKGFYEGRDFGYEIGYKDGHEESACVYEAILAQPDKEAAQ